MSKLIRKVIRLVSLACVICIAVCAARAIMARLHEEPDAGNGPRTASYDSWPPVPPAPDRSTDPT
ncbi:MAG: hypothetical protein ABSC00_06855 [Acidimicrobiales bacterium]|jgi:hypothetical protein